MRKTNNRRKNKTNVRFSLRQNHTEQNKNEQELCITQFRNTRLFMDMVKKCEKMIFRERENQMDQNMRLMEQQNKLMENLKQVNILKSSHEIAPASSIKVLEELDLNKKQAYQSLEFQNHNLRENIQELELTLESLQKLQKSHSLCNQYLVKIQNKIRKREKLRQMLTEKVQAQKQQIETLKSGILRKYGEEDKDLVRAVQLILK